MLTDIFITDLLLKKKYSRIKILAFLSTLYIVFYFVLALIFRGLFGSNTTILPAIIIFILFFFIRFNNINKYINKMQNKSQ
jgi:hypothetical protein